MTGRDLSWRFGGILALAAAGGTSLLHRHVLATHIHGPATSIEAVLGLLGFALASLGILLLIQGARLRDGLVHDVDRVRDNHDPEPVKIHRERAVPTAIATDSSALAWSRAGLATILADRAIRAAAAGEKRAAIPPNIFKAGQSS